MNPIKLLVLLLIELVLFGCPAEAAHCRLGLVYITHAHRCVGDRSRLARQYVWPRWHYAHLRRPHIATRWYVTAHIPIESLPNRSADRNVEPSQQEEEGPGKRADPGAEATPPPASGAASSRSLAGVWIETPNAFAHSLLFRPLPAPIIWRLP
jgi:hypothetical protein